MVKEDIGLVLLIMIMLTGCSNKAVVANNASKTTNVKTEQNNASETKSIPFKYAFTGFVPVKDVVNDLPVGIKVFNTQEEWAIFFDKSFPYADIPLPIYSGGIDFTKDSLVYYSVVDAKVDFYAIARQIDKIIIQNQQLNITTKDLDGNLAITANNSENSDKHRFVILVTIEKQYLKYIK